MISAARLISLFVESPKRPVVASHGPEHVAAADPDPRPVVAILSSPRDAIALGSAVALVLARRTRSHCSVVALWSPASDALEPLGSLPGASRLAQRLARSGVTVAAAGQLVRVGLPADPADADRAARRLLAEVAVPVAVVLARAREPVLDALLCGADRVLVAGGRDAPAGLVRTALADAARVAPGAMELDVQVGSAARSTLALGLTVPPRLRGRIEEALR